MITKTLPTDSDERKEIPVLAGCLDYFPAAIAGVASHSKKSNDKHNPGEMMHHSRAKSSDHAECVVRHLMDVSALLRDIEQFGFEFTKVDELLYEVNALSWRSLALSQELHERFTAVPMAPRARNSTEPLYNKLNAKLNAALDVERTRCASVLNTPPPKGADGLARALHWIDSQVAKDAPSPLGGSPTLSYPERPAGCEAAQPLPEWPTETPSKR